MESDHISAKKINHDDMSYNKMNADVINQAVFVNTYSPEYFNECVYDDMKLFNEYLICNNYRYNSESIPAFMRMIYRQDISDYLKNTQQMTYAEYFMINGFSMGRSYDYFKDELLNYLKERYIESKNGFVSFSRNSFDYDSVRKVCRISTRIYNGYKKISNIQLAENMSRSYELRSCYCDENRSFDIAVISAGTVIGKLNKTYFRSTGIGSYLVPLMYSDKISFGNINFTSDDYPFIIFDLNFR